VYAVDFPGMGWSDIVPGASYEEPALRAAMVRVVEQLDLSELTLAGESIGATIALTASIDLGDRVRRVVAFNTYDFADGLKRASLFARLVAGSVEAPVVGPTLARFENKRIIRGVMRGSGRGMTRVLQSASMSSVASAGAPDTQEWPERSSATWTA
jgi:pimeloyl-ACP methyl ester carboxylesterase